MENTEYTDLGENTNLTPTTNSSTGISPKWISVLSYITLIGWVVSLVLNSKNKDQFAAFHIRQALGVHGLLIAAKIVLTVPILGWLAWIVGFALTIVLWFIGIIDAFTERSKPVPVLGEKFQEWFSTVN